MSIKIGSNTVAGLPIMDSELSDSSNRAVQNRTITLALNTKADDTDVVHLTGTETISGAKTLSDVFTVSDEIIRQDLNVSYNVIPLENISSPISWKDSYDIKYASVETVKDTDGNNEIKLNVRGVNGSWSSVGLGLGVDQNNNDYAFAPTPVSLSSNDNTIATTAWIHNKFQIVDALPANPDSNTFYCIPE